MTAAPLSTQRFEPYALRVAAMFKVWARGFQPPAILLAPMKWEPLHCTAGEFAVWLIAGDVEDIPGVSGNIDPIRARSRDWGPIVMITSGSEWEFAWPITVQEFWRSGTYNQILRAGAPPLYAIQTFLRIAGLPQS